MVKYILMKKIKIIYRPHSVRTKLRIMAVKNSQTADDGRSKQWNFIVLWFYVDRTH